MSEQLIAEMRKQQSEIAEQLRTISELQKQVAELTPLKETLTSIREMVGQDDVVAAIRDMQKRATEAEAVQKKAAIETAIREALGDLAKSAEAAQIITEMVGAVDGADAAKARVKTLLEQEHVKAMLKALVVNQSGPAALVGESFGGNRQQVDDSPEAIAAARATWGI